MNIKRLNEIAERKGAIRTEMEKADAEKLRSLSEETDKLLTEEQEIRTRLDMAGKLGEKREVEKPEKENDMEKRGRELIQGRSVLVTATGVLLKEHQATTITPTFNELSTLIDRVRHMDLPGGESFEQPYIDGYGTGDYKAENLAYASAEPTFGSATIAKAKVTAYAEFTEELQKLPAADYAAEIMKGIPLSMRKKISREILIGDGETNHLQGIFDAGVAGIDATTDIDFAAIDENTLDEIVYSFGGSEDVEDPAVLILHKTDLKAFALLRDSNGRKIYEINTNGNTGTINGVPYVLNSVCEAISDPATTTGQYAMAYGPLSNYLLTVFSQMDIRRSDDFKFSTGMICLRGSVFVGGNVVAKNGFLRVKRT